MKDLNPKDDSKVPKMDSFLLLYEEKELYGDFFDHFFKSIVGYSKFSSSVLSKSDKDITSMSDEAFTLVLLENLYDHWIDIMRKTNGRNHQKCMESRATRITALWFQMLRPSTHLVASSTITMVRPGQSP